MELQIVTKDGNLTTTRIIDLDADCSHPLYDAAHAVAAMVNEVGMNPTMFLDALAEYLEISINMLVPAEDGRNKTTDHESEGSN